MPKSLGVPRPPGKVVSDRQASRAMLKLQKKIPEVIQIEHAQNDSFISSIASCEKEHDDQGKTQGKKEKGKVQQTANAAVCHGQMTPQTC